MVILETSRLLLSTFEATDGIHLFHLNSDPEVLQYTGDAAFRSVAEATLFIENYTHYQEYGYGRWKVLLKENGTFLGFCGLKYTPKKDQVDIGFRFSKKYWGKGFATEAAHASLHYGFDHLDLYRIVGRAMQNNTASLQVLKKLGMEQEEEFIENGRPWLQYTITRESFRQNNNY